MRTLVQRLEYCRELLDGVRVAVARMGDPFEQRWSGLYGDPASQRQAIDGWLELIEARGAAWQELERLDEHGIADAGVPAYRHARLLRVQAYMAADWALADGVSAWAGRILCSHAKASNPANPPNLPDFVRDKDRAIAPVHNAIKGAFGWPIALSYALRNHFLHDGAHRFFKDHERGSHLAAASESWQCIEASARKLGGEPGMRRAEFVEIPSPPEDLRAVIRACEAETDEALGVLAIAASGLLKAHLACQLGEA